MQPPAAPSRQSPQDGLVLAFSICQVCEEEVPELDPISLARLLSLTSPNGSFLIRPLYLLLYNTEDSSSQVYSLCCKITKVKTVIFRPLPHIALHCPILPYIALYCRVLSFIAVQVTIYFSTHSFISFAHLTIDCGLLVAIYARTGLSSRTTKSPQMNITSNAGTKI